MSKKVPAKKKSTRAGATKTTGAARTGKKAGAVRTGKKVGVAKKSAAKSTNTRSQRQNSARPASTKKPGVIDKLLNLPRGVYIVALILFILICFYEPARNLYAAQRDQALLQEQKAQIEAKNQASKDKIESLSTEDGIKDEARLHGYVEPGEQPVTVEGLEEEQESEEETPATSVSASDTTEQPDPWYVSLTDFIFGYNREEHGGAS